MADKTGFAKAFKRDIGREDEVAKEEWPVGVASSLLMNDMRKKLFLFLCQYPGSHLRVIAESLEISSTTATWHLRKLSQSNIIIQKKVQKKSVFYPINLLDPNEIELFSVLCTDKYKDLYLAIKKNPGINQKGLSEKLNISHQSVLFLSKKLIELGLISKLSDGKFIRYYPTKLLEERADEMKSRNKQFRMDLLRFFKTDGLDPKLVKRSDDYMLVDLLVGMKRERVRIDTNPYISIFK